MTAFKVFLPCNAYVIIIWYSSKAVLHSFMVFLKETALLYRLKVVSGKWPSASSMLHKLEVLKVNYLSSEHSCLDSIQQKSANFVGRLCTGHIIVLAKKQNCIRNYSYSTLIHWLE